MALQTNNLNGSVPAVDFAAVTPSDSTNLSRPCRGIYVGVGGDVVAVTYAGTAVTFKGAPSGAILPIQAIRVNSTNTTATNMVALF
jgi:hypothetical protein